MKTLTLPPVTEPVQVYRTLDDHFTKEAEEISDPERKERVLKAIRSLNTPVYATIAYVLTTDSDLASQVHDHVLAEVLYVLFLDDAHEKEASASRSREKGKLTDAAKHATKAREYKTRAEQEHARVISSLSAEQKAELSLFERDFALYWEFEKYFSQRMRNGDPINETEMMNFVEKKSGDVYLYAKLLEFQLRTKLVPKQFKTLDFLDFLIHAQLKRDLAHDETDIFRDHQEGMPNPFLIQAYRKGLYIPGKVYSSEELQTITRRVRDVHHCAVRSDLSPTLPISSPFDWIKECRKPYKNGALPPSLS
ncbi:hypothetical protein J4410_07240 [Candidatus Woesearchaeota archaeon]|nr:hypothetical protein [Candidatus Woesearchaeota archaeon]